MQQQVPQRSFILTTATVVLVIALAVAAYAYDSSRDDLIAKGVTVAGVDVGGLKLPEARRRIQRELVPALERPVSVRYRGRRFILTPRRAGLRADAVAMANEALHRSRDGTIVTRVARDLTGGEEDARIPARVHYSRAAVTAFAQGVKKTLDRPAQDAKLNFPSLTRVKEHNGLFVYAAPLLQRVERALAQQGVGRRVQPQVKILKPKVTRAQLARKYPTLIVVERSAFTLTLYKHLRLKHSYTIAVGQIGLETPAGLYHIQNKQVNPSWQVPNSAWAGSLAGRLIPPGPDDPLKARWLGIFAGAGIHGTDQTWSLGAAVSHGCIRMSIPDVIQLYSQVPVGTPIYIG
jgi:lipoprotein-anchoring transpeptidase ErfK/SrfK